MAAVLVPLAIAALSGCTDAPSPARSHPAATPTPTPISTSDADALAAATEAYKQYLAVIDQIAQDGGKDPDRVKPYVDAAGLTHERHEAQRLAGAGARQIGSTVLAATSLQVNEAQRVVINACQDVSAVQVVDSSGASLVAKDRPDEIPYQATFTRRGGSLVMVADEFWSGPDVCN